MNSLKNFSNDLLKCKITFWVIKRKLNDGVATYSSMRVSIDDKFSEKLKKIILDNINSKKYKFLPYDFITDNQDETIYTIPSKDTDFVKVHNEIKKGLNAQIANSFTDLTNSWIYVAQLQNNDRELFAIRKINSLSNVKKVNALFTSFFKNGTLFDLDQKDVFSLDSKIDFFVFEENIFIKNIKEFENALNFRNGMEKKKTELLNDEHLLSRFTDIEPFNIVIGNNLRLLRKVAKVYKSEYYKNDSFMSELIKINESEKWGLNIIDNKIEVREDNVETILTLLDNSRLKSLINGEVFDASVKTKVQIA